MVVRNVLKTKEVLCGGGSVEMQLSAMIRKEGNECQGKGFLVYTCIAQAFEVIPFVLAQNFGIDGISALQLLRKRHNLNEFWYGIDSEKIIGDMRENYIYEPVEVKRNIIRTSFAAVIALIQIDMTILTRARTE